MTIRLYHSDSYLREFAATVAGCLEYDSGKCGIILDQTAFYPESGGQPFDTGSINGIPVSAVYQEEDAIIHIVNQPLPKGESVQGAIDWDRRFDYMQQHSGEHILSGAFLQIVSAANVGFHLNNFSGQIDIAMDSFSDDQAEAVEQLANSIVFENRPLHCEYIPADTLGALPLRKKPAKAYANIRVVNIGDFDLCPCGGTHVASTGEIGVIKIRSWERSKQHIRIDFVCGYRALKDYRQKNQAIAIMSARLSAPAETAVDAFAKKMEQLQTLHKECTQAKKMYTELLVEKLSAQAYEKAGIKIATACLETDADSVRRIAAALIESANTVALIASLDRENDKVQVVFSCSKELPLHMGNELKAVLLQVNGRGGGGPYSAQGGFSGTSQADTVLTVAKQAIISNLG